MSEQKELISRLEAKKKHFQAELASMKADAIGTASEKKSMLKDKINEIADTIEKGKEDFSEASAKKMNDWLK